MKKFLLIFFASLTLLFLSFSQISAADCPSSGDPGATGLVPCGVTCSCTILNFFAMLGRIYEFLVKDIAAPLAILALTIGGVLILISAGNPNLMSTGKKIVYVSIIGLFLVFASWLIVDLILGALGYSMGKPWWQL